MTLGAVDSGGASHRPSTRATEGEARGRLRLAKRMRRGLPWRSRVRGAPRRRGGAGPLPPKRTRPRGRGYRGIGGLVTPCLSETGYSATRATARTASVAHESNTPWRGSRNGASSGITVARGQSHPHARRRGSPSQPPIRFRRHIGGEGAGGSGKEVAWLSPALPPWCPLSSLHECPRHPPRAGRADQGIRLFGEGFATLTPGRWTGIASGSWNVLSVARDRTEPGSPSALHRRSFSRPPS